MINHDMLENVIYNTQINKIDHVIFVFSLKPSD